MNDIEFINVTKRYGDVIAAADINLTVERGAFIALLGPSGCGKTTCLRMIGGFEEPSEGRVLIRGADMAGVPAYQRPVNMVFQQYALFPHFNVEQNIAYGLKQARPRLERAEINRRVGEALELVQLNNMGARRIDQLSGGQQQRVALARALVNKPAVLLLDEPLAALDKKLRTDMQIELQNLQRTLGITFVLVTHDQEEALSMSNQVCVMNKGRIVQIGTPDEVYHHPKDLFVAGFVGKTNFIDGQVVATDKHLRVKLANGNTIAARGKDLLKDEVIKLSLRPEAIYLSRNSNSANLLGNGTVTNRIFLGSTVEYAVDVLGLGVIMSTSDHSHGHEILQAGETVAVEYAEGAAFAFVE